MNEKMNELEEGTQIQLDFDKLEKASNAAKGILPVAVQHADTKEIILVAYATRQAMEHSVKSGNATFWSTSRNELWEKGATSGETFELLEMRVNCEQNSLVYIVRPRRGNICHTNNQAGEPRNCYYRKINVESMELEFLDP